MLAYGKWTVRAAYVTKHKLLHFHSLLKLQNPFYPFQLQKEKSRRTERRFSAAVAIAQPSYLLAFAVGCLLPIKQILEFWVIERILVIFMHVCLKKNKSAAFEDEY